MIVMAWTYSRQCVECDILVWVGLSYYEEVSIILND